MAKGSLVMGKQSGKLGQMVLSVSGGEQISRAYNPNVANPNTNAQVSQRAKMKLMSQLSASLSNAIAYQKSGLVSARNKFISKNIDKVYVNGGVAQVSYENLQLADGNRGLPGLLVIRTENVGINVALQEGAAGAVDRVVYFAFKKSSENQLQLLSSAVVTDSGLDDTYGTLLPYADGEIVVYAYGMKDGSASASAKYGNYHVETGVDIAALLANRSLSAADYGFTQTRGTTLFSGENEVVQAGANQVMIYITPSGNGTVSGDGFTGNRKAVNIGASVSVTATPNEGSTFVGWRKNGENVTLSTQATYTFTASTNLDLVAVFNTPSGGGQGDAD